jgi:uncharacterized iron-regulated membrane protein
MNVWLLKLHRWLALLLALPLVVVIITGLILSFEPIVVGNAIKPGSITTEQMTTALTRYDPQNRASRIYLEHDTGSLAIGGRGMRTTRVDVRTGTVRKGAGATQSFFRTSRRLHETLLIDADWLVDASAFAMLGLIALGMLMGWPKLSNSIVGWHKGVAWFLFPLLILSPLTGLGIAYRISLAGPPSAAARAAPPADMAAALRTVGTDHDLSKLIWLRKRGKRVLARLNEDGEYKVYAVTNSGAVVLPRNWPRLLHEGNWLGSVSGSINAIIASAMLVLLGTGLFSWGRRQLRRRSRATARTEPLR